MMRWHVLGEGVLWLAGLACVSVGASDAAVAGLARKQASLIGTSLQQAGSDAQTGHRPGMVTGRLESASLKLSVPIVGDYNPASLVRGVGHVPGTALPGGLGNMVLAGHRDTFFRPLRLVRPGTILVVFTAGGRYRYVVDRSEIVGADAVGVLEIGERPELTLITCYPFNFIGAAPERFIVHAHLTSAVS